MASSAFAERDSGARWSAVGAGMVLARDCWTESARRVWGAGSGTAGEWEGRCLGRGRARADRLEQGHKNFNQWRRSERARSLHRTQCHAIMSLLAGVVVQQRQASVGNFLRSLSIISSFFGLACSHGFLFVPPKLLNSSRHPSFARSLPLCSPHPPLTTAPRLSAPPSANRLRQCGDPTYDESKCRDRGGRVLQAVNQ